MHILKLDPRALKDNPDDARRSKSSPQSDALLLATVKAVGIIQPPVVSPESGGGNGYIIQAGHRRVRQAIAAGLEEIEVIVREAANDNPASWGAMHSMVENIAREPLNPVDQWRGIERLVALGWTEEAIAVALALPVRQIRKLRLLANVLPAMLDHMALGDMPNEQQLRTVASASLDEQKEVWKAHKPKKTERADWYNVARALAKTRMYAKDASFGDDLASAYGIEWVEDLFSPADEDTRYTTNVEAFKAASPTNRERLAHVIRAYQVAFARSSSGPVPPARPSLTHIYMDHDQHLNAINWASVQAIAEKAFPYSRARAATIPAAEGGDVVNAVKHAGLDFSVFPNLGLICDIRETEGRLFVID